MERMLYLWHNIFNFRVVLLLLLVVLTSLPVNVNCLIRFKDKPKPASDISRTNSNQNHNHNISSDIPWRQIKFISAQQSLAQSRWWHKRDVTDFSAKGMDHLYMITQLVINWLQPHNGLPYGVIRDDLFDNTVNILQENRGQLLSHFLRLILAASVCVCVAIIVWLIGLLCCCCWCSAKRAKNTNNRNAGQSCSTSSGNGSPNNRRNASKKKRYRVEGSCDPCCRSFVGCNLFILLLLISFFVICAFVTNEYVRNGVHQLPNTVNQSTDDIILYLNNTQYEVNTLLRTNFGQLEQELGDSLDRSGLIVKNRLALLSHASSLENLTDIVAKLDSILNDLRILSSETTELRLLTLQLQDKLSRSKTDLEIFFRQCKNKICDDLRRKYQKILNSFAVTTRIDDLPDLSPLMQNITNLLKANIVHEIGKGKQSFDEISLKIQSTVNSTIPDIKRQIKAVGHELGLAADDINEALRQPFGDLFKVKSNTKIGAQYIDKYEIYRWYGFFVSAIVVTVILVCYMFGLICGACSEQPTRHSYKRRRHQKSSTLKCFRCGLVLTLLLFCPLLIYTVFLFIFGGLSDKVLCYYMENPSRPQSRQLMSILQNKFESTGYSETLNVIQGVKPNVADVLTRCHQNQSLYNVLQLNRYNNIQINSGRTVNVNITDILAFKQRYRIEEKLDTFLTRVNINPSNIVILTSDGYYLLESLSRTSLGTLNFSSYASVIKKSITPLDLVSISTELEQEAGRLPKSEVENVAKLRNIAMDLKSQIEIVMQIKNTIEKLTEGAEKIEKKASYGEKGLREALTSLLRQAEQAQQFLTQKGRNEIRNVAKAFVTDMSSLVDQYAQHVIEEIESGLGKCEPVSRAFNATLMAFCKEIVLPYNGYCCSMISALYLCALSTIFTWFLSRLYRKVKSFRTRRESIDSTLENLDEDDIPLAHVDSKNNLSGYESRSGGPTPSAPFPLTDDNWSPGAPPPHFYGSRPPPYNFGLK